MSRQLKSSLLQCLWLRLSIWGSYCPFLTNIAEDNHLLVNVDKSNYERATGPSLWPSVFYQIFCYIFLSLPTLYISFVICIGSLCVLSHDVNSQISSVDESFLSNRRICESLRTPTIFCIKRTLCFFTSILLAHFLVLSCTVNVLLIYAS